MRLWRGLRTMTRSLPKSNVLPACIRVAIRRFTRTDNPMAARIVPNKKVLCKLWWVDHDSVCPIIHICYKPVAHAGQHTCNCGATLPNHLSDVERRVLKANAQPT